MVHHEGPAFGPDSATAARAALAADRQGACAAMHARPMRTPFAVIAAHARAAAAEMDLDTARLAQDMAAPAADAALDCGAAQAASLGLAGVPALVVGRSRVAGAVSRATLTALIAHEPAGSAPPLCPPAG